MCSATCGVNHIGPGGPIFRFGLCRHGGWPELAQRMVTIQIMKDHGTDPSAVNPFGRFNYHHVTIVFLWDPVVNTKTAMVSEGA